MQRIDSLALRVRTCIATRPLLMANIASSPLSFYTLPIIPIMKSKKEAWLDSDPEKPAKTRLSPPLPWKERRAS